MSAAGDYRPVSVTEADGRKKTIGYVLGDVFHTVRSEKRHMFRHGAPSVEEAIRRGVATWALDQKACDGMLKQGVTECHIFTAKNVYTVPLAKFPEEGYIVQYGTHRKQYALNLMEFLYHKPTPEQKRIHGVLKRGGK